MPNNIIIISNIQNFIRKGDLNAIIIYGLKQWKSWKTKTKKIQRYKRICENQQTKCWNLNKLNLKHLESAKKLAYIYVNVYVKSRHKYTTTILGKHFVTFG